MFTEIDFNFLVEIAAYLAIVVGVALIYLPAGLIIGGALAILAVELQPSKDDAQDA